MNPRGWEKSVYAKRLTGAGSSCCLLVMISSLSWPQSRVFSQTLILGPAHDDLPLLLLNALPFLPRAGAGERVRDEGWTMISNYCRGLLREGRSVSNQGCAQGMEKVFTNLARQGRRLTSNHHHHHHTTTSHDKTSKPAEERRRWVTRGDLERLNACHHERHYRCSNGFNFLLFLWLPLVASSAK